MIRHVGIKIYGRVQGIGFRYATREKARELGVKGWVKNLPTGNVYVEAEGGEEPLEKFLDFCRRGPAWSEVEKIEYEFSDDEIKNFTSFQIKY